ncbi:hypothetical protein RRG08_052173 [Elysia crispata]|uniref:Uncharacterized protein n=1 Tax=Elysia crispata TaxID=231223 RepID=A0AAE1AKH5_9GAST|nr:hypothetical protein RRG08_052173 [Elysia crispata]
MKSPGQCKANLVLLNSNNLPFVNVPQEKQALENRMFLFRNLKRSKILPTALKGMDATKPNPKFLRLIEPPSVQELQDLVAGIYPRSATVVDNLGIVPTFNGDWEQWSNELSDNRKVLESDMAAPEFLIDMNGTLASQPIEPSPELFTPPCPDSLLNVRVETEWPFESQPQQDEDLRADLQYFFPTLSTPDVVPPTQKEDVVQSEESRLMMDTVYEAYCAYEPDQLVSQRVPFDQVEDENPWRKYDTRWPGASTWAVDNPAPSAYHQLQWSRAKDSPVDYLELKTGAFEENVQPAPIDAWSTEDFYLDGAGFFIHNECDKTTGNDIKYILLKNGVWDIVTKTRVPPINREGKAVRSITVNAAKYLNFFPSDDVPDACTPKMLPVWLPRSFNNTQEKWSENDQDTIADLFYLICGYTQPFKARVLNISTGPIHKWTDVSDCFPDLIAEMEEEAQASAKRIIESNSGLDMVDGIVDQPIKRSQKVVKFLTKFIETAAATVAMVVTLLKIWDEIF